MVEHYSTDILEIHGGKPLKGTVHISGAKNEVTKLMVASTLFDSPITIENVPNIGDVDMTADLLKTVGVKVHHNLGKKTLTADGTHLSRFEAVYETGRANRLSILLAGPLLHKFGKAVVQKPGGCRIGERPLDLHLFYLHKLGITIDEDDTLIRLKGRLSGATIEFPYKSVGATEGALLASIYASGKSVIKNVATEPEVVELIKILQQAGALITVDSEGAISVTGTETTLSLDHPVRVIGDRVEAVSYAAAAAATGGEVVLKGIEQESIMTAITYLRKIGVVVEIEDDDIKIAAPRSLKPLRIETDPHPAFATDFQQVFTVMLSQAKGTSYVHETVFDNRFAYLEQLNILGGQFSVSNLCAPFLSCRFSELHNHTAQIDGPMHFHGGTARITDLRASFALVIAGLLSEHPTYLSEVHHLLRGYDTPIEKLRGLGADLKLTKA